MNLVYLFYIISFLWIISEIVLARTKKSNTKNDLSSHDKKSLKKIWITIMLSISLGVFTSYIPFGRISAIPYLGISGIIILILGLIIRWIAIISLKESFTVDVTVNEGQKIIQTGIYKYIRHPAYSGSLLSFLGLSLVFSNYLTLFIVNIPIITVFLYRIRIEEQALTKEIGQEYVDYVKLTKKLIPFIY